MVTLVTIQGSTPSFLLLAWHFALLHLCTVWFYCLQRSSNICCLRWVDIKIETFFWGLHSPWCINYRLWPGFLFLVWLTLFTFGSLLRDNYKPIINLYILIFAFVSPTGVYKHWPLNVLEFSFLINLGILSTLVATFSHSSGPHASSFVYPSVAIAMVLFACINCTAVWICPTIAFKDLYSQLSQERQNSKPYKSLRFGKKLKKKKRLSLRYTISLVIMKRFSEIIKVW